MQRFSMVDTAEPVDVEFDFESINNVEEAAYQDGYRQGFEHGALHGTFEGRELGREKGFELWEEVAYYGGMAEVWRVYLEQANAAGHSSRKQNKQIQHLVGLERLISFFPTINTSSDASLDIPQPLDAADEEVEGANDADAEAGADAAEVAGAEANNDDELGKLDMLTLLEKIRAKYRLTCSVLGIPPQRAASLMQIGPSASGSEGRDKHRRETTSVLVAGKLVDPSQLKY